MKKKLILTFLIIAALATACTSQAPEKNDNQITSKPINEDNSGPQEQTKEFNVVVKNWEFNPSEITVNRGDKVRLVLKSIDVEHGIAIPDFGVSERLLPGKTVTVEFTADKTGEFTFFCNVACGSGHRNMKGKLIVN